jgi:outer membrane protein TolC
MKYLFVIIVLIGLNPDLFAQSGPTGSVSMSLEEAVSYALDNSYSVQYAEMDVRAASRRNKELTAIGLPQINGEVSFTNFLELPTTVIPANAFNPGAPADELVDVQFGTDYSSTASLSASQLIFDGTYIIGLKAAKTYVKLNQQAREQTENEIKRQVTEAYGLALLAIESHAILNKNYDNLQTLLLETEQLYEAGFREELDVDQLRLQLSGLENTRRKAERNVQITHNLLKFQIGMPVATELVLSSPLESLAQSAFNPQLIEKEPSLDKHADLLPALTNVELRKLNVRVERMAGAPNLAGFFTTQQQAFRNDLGFFGQNSQWFPNTFWGVQLNVPIFSGFMRHNKVQQAKIDVERAETQLDQAREGVLLEIATQKANYTSALEVYNTEKENMTLAEKIDETTRKKYQEGLATSFDLQQAENQMLSAQQSYLRATLDLINSRAALEKALDIQ